MTSPTIDTLSPEKPSNNPSKTFDQGPTQSFFDFTIASSEQSLKQATQKYDMSEPFNGIVLTSREITYDQLRSRTSDSFADHIAKTQANKKESKIYEYFIFIKALSDYYKTITLDELELYTRLKAVVSSKNPKEQFLKEDLDTINENFKTAKDKTTAISILEENIISGAHRFYSSNLKAQGDYMVVSVKFYDKNQLEYGEAIKNITPSVDIPQLKNLQRKIREFKTKAKYKKAFEEQDKINKAKQLEDKEIMASNDLGVSA